MMPAVGNTAGGYHDPVDARLRDLRALVEDLVARDANPSSVLTSVAEGLTGELGGYRSRAASVALRDAYDTVADVPLEDLKAAERGARDARLRVAP